MEAKNRTLSEKVRLLDLRPRDAPPGIKVGTFGKWIRAIKRGGDIGEIATAYLHLYCDGRITEGGGLIAPPPQGMPVTLVQEGPILAERAAPVPKKRTVHLGRDGHNGIGIKVRKLKSGPGGSFWMLYCINYRYRLPVGDADCEIHTEEGVFTLSDFGFME
jgi:hypothetical protein